MAFYVMAFMGTAPFGSLLAGALAARVGTPETVLIGGLACAAGAAVFAMRLPALRAVVRPIYQEKGIIPAIATGIGDATNLRNEAQR
jgi:hypothetical protein